MKYSGTFKLTMPNDREIVLRRTFGAPPERVFEALTTPEKILRWFGPHGWAPTACEFELEVGGAWSIVLQDPDGNSMLLHGRLLEAVPPRRLAFTENWEGFGTGENLVTMGLAEHDGTTHYTVTVLYPSQEVRDSILAAGMEAALAESYDELEELLEAS